ncbi:MAG: hybrid sensor histidine kinase/response regulator [Comamonadaceae bacterium]|nr:MAG: hybrid sensor histidine kinase/response regulator [Comamonadaceae bacterium]
MTLLQRAVRALRPASTGALTGASRARLLDMSYSRLRFSVYMMPLVALPLVVYLGWDPQAGWMRAWGLVYLVLSLVVYGVAQLYRAEQRLMTDEAMLARWQPRVHALAWLHGAGLSLGLLAMAQVAVQEASMLAYLVMAHIVSTNATHQTPAVGVFLRFFATSWNTMMVMAYWIFPALWHVVVPLAAIYSLVIYRHALLSHHFSVEQLQLKERSEELAAKFLAAREETELALREKSLFLSTASHDLRQPLHAMSMLVEAVALRNRDAAIAPMLHDLRHGMDSMNLMFNSLLDLSKLEAGHIEQRPVPVVLQTVLKELATLFREQARRRGIALRLRLPRGAAIVMADPALLRQAVANLTHNALRYTERGGVLIALRALAGSWRIEVWDTGVGIAPADRDRIFSPFYRNAHAWRIDSAGHGLGLAVVARCARLLDAALGFQSRPGRGSRFWLGLPRAAQALAGDPATPQAHAGAGLPRLAGNCLVVDDDPLVNAAWREMLSAWGIQGFFAENATQAFQLLDYGFQPDAILCDQRLRSGESGVEVLQALLVRCPQAGGAMVSGEFDSSELQRAEQEGRIVLRKPVDLAQLHGVLSQWLGRTAAGSA